MVSIWIWSGKGGDERGVGDRLDQGASETRAGGRELLGLLARAHACATFRHLLRAFSEY